MENQLIKNFILDYFHLDKLCPNCNGPLEKFNQVHCDKCDLKRHIESNLVMVENACLQIRHNTDINKQPKKHREELPECQDENETESKTE
jgi:hypothetical protein